MRRFVSRCWLMASAVALMVTSAANAQKMDFL
jgi:hypothetical protein